MQIFVLASLTSYGSFSFSLYWSSVSKSVFDINVYIYWYLLGDTEALLFVYTLRDFVVFEKCSSLCFARVDVLYLCRLYFNIPLTVPVKWRLTSELADIFSLKKMEIKLFRVQPTKAHGNRRIIAPLILNLSSRRRDVCSFRQLSLSFKQTKETWYPFSRRLGGTQKPGVDILDKTNLLSLPVIEPRFFQIIA